MEKIMMKKAVLGLSFLLLLLPMGSFAEEGAPAGPPPGHDHKMGPHAAARMATAADHIKGCSTAECKKGLAEAIPLMDELNKAHMTIFRELVKEKPSEAVIDGANSKILELQGRLAEIHKKSRPSGGRLGGAPQRPVGPSPSVSPR